MASKNLFFGVTNLHVSFLRTQNLSKYLCNVVNELLFFMIGFMWILRLTDSCQLSFIFAYLMPQYVNLLIVKL